MILKTKNGIPFLQFTNLLKIDDLFHGVFLREGGISSLNYESLNLSHGVGDKKSNVIRNRKIVSRIIGSDLLFFINQKHGTSICITETDDCNKMISNMAVGQSADAVISSAIGLFPVIQVADCQAVMIADPIKRIVANIHSGWRGSIGNIIGKTVQSMSDNFGCRPSDLIAGIGPSLGPCCAEFVNYRTEIPEPFWDYHVNEDHFDFWALSHDQISATGVNAANISIGGICTKCNPQLFFSYRKSRRTGRFGTFIGFNK